VISITYQTIEESVLQELLGLVDENSIKVCYLMINADENSIKMYYLMINGMKIPSRCTIS
jgi:hypothetical protein